MLENDKVLYLREKMSIQKISDIMEKTRKYLKCLSIYSLLHLTGYDLPLEELKNFRQT